MLRITRLFPYLFGGLVLGLLLWITNQFIMNINQIHNINRERSNMPRIALLLEGPTYDQGWNSGAFESLNELQKQYRFPLKIANNLKAQDITNVAKTYAENGYDLVIGHGIVFSQPFTKLAPSFPRTHFISFNGSAQYPNQTTIRYDMKPAGYIVGKLAALMSKHHKVGYIVVDKSSEFDQVEGFKQGALSANAAVEIAKVSDFNDISGALIATRALIEKKVDVIYTTGDSFNLPVITAAQKANIYAVGYVSDQRYIAPNHVLASMIQDVQQVYRMMLDQYFKGTLPSGKVTYGIAEGVNYLSPFGPMVPDSVREQINKEVRILMDPH